MKREIGHGGKKASRSQIGEDPSENGAPDRGRSLEQITKRERVLSQKKSKGRRCFPSRRSEVNRKKLMKPAGMQKKSRTGKRFRDLERRGDVHESKIMAALVLRPTPRGENKRETRCVYEKAQDTC